MSSSPMPRTTSDDGLPPLREVIRKYELSARKTMGQNFILDLNLTRRIARAAGSLDDRTIIEIGPGPGGLTRGLLMEGAKHVIAIERDRRCLDALREIERAYPGRLEIIHDDALEIDYPKLTSDKAAITANLPYSIGTALLVKWLEQGPWPPFYDRMTLMFQKEVAERITARPGTKTYGRLSILAQFRARAEIHMTLPPEAFTPAPKVASSLVTIVPLSPPPFDCKVRTLSKITASAFQQRRKMLRKSLAKIHPYAETLLRESGIDPTRRAESLSVEEFCRLARAIEEKS